MLFCEGFVFFGNAVELEHERISDRDYGFAWLWAFCPD